MLLKPIIALTRKGIPFKWGKEQEEAFQEVKCRISSPPVLHLPRAVGRLVLFLDTSKVGKVVLYGNIKMVDLALLCMRVKHCLKLAFVIV